jgi:hypothetical protein
MLMIEKIYNQIQERFIYFLLIKVIAESDLILDICFCIIFLFIDFYYRSSFLILIARQLFLECIVFLCFFIKLFLLQLSLFYIYFVLATVDFVINEIFSKKLSLLLQFEAILPTQK